MTRIIFVVDQKYGVFLRVSVDELLSERRLIRLFVPCSKVENA